ncbi:MAG: hypothetical protein ACOC0F_02780 [archaeon]
MSEKNRRDVLKLGTAAAGTALIPTVGAAHPNSNGSRDGSEIEIIEVTTISESNGENISGIVIERDDSREYYIGKLSEEKGRVSVTQANQSTYQSMTAEVGTMSHESAKERFSTLDGGKDVVKRWETWTGTNGSCDAYDYTHRKGRIAVELHDEVDEIGASVVVSALSQIISASSLGGPYVALLTAAVSTVVLGAAFLTDVTEFTVGAIEFDKSASGWNQTFSMTKGGTGYGVSMGNLIPVEGNPGHPGRL